MLREANLLLRMKKLLPKTGEEESYQLIRLAVAFLMASIMIKVKQKFINKIDGKQVQ